MSGTQVQHLQDNLNIDTQIIYNLAHLLCSNRNRSCFELNSTIHYKITVYKKCTIGNEKNYTISLEITISSFFPLSALAIDSSKKSCSRRSTDKMVALLPARGMAAHGSRQLYRCVGGLSARGVEFSDTAYSYIMCNNGEWNPKPQCVGEQM